MPRVTIRAHTFAHINLVLTTLEPLQFLWRNNDKAGAYLRLRQGIAACMHIVDM